MSKSRHFYDYLWLLLQAENRQLDGSDLIDLLDHMDILWRELTGEERQLATRLAKRLGVE